MCSKLIEEKELTQVLWHQSRHTEQALYCIDVAVDGDLYLVNITEGSKGFGFRCLSLRCL